MHSTGIVRKLDVLGRFTLPSEIRKQLDLCESDSLEVFVDHHKIILQKYQPADIFSGTMEELIEYRGRKVSKHSILEMAKIAGLKIQDQK